jgi:hypothetical protein
MRDLHGLEWSRFVSNICFYRKILIYPFQTCPTMVVNIWSSQKNTASLAVWGKYHLFLILTLNSWFPLQSKPPSSFNEDIFTSFVIDAQFITSKGHIPSSRNATKKLEVLEVRNFSVHTQHKMWCSCLKITWTWNTYWIELLAINKLINQIISGQTFSKIRAMKTAPSIK